ncbi:MAG: hypothetical protein AB7Q37_01135 [Pyrinomonadaceae bacterium]
MLRFLTVFLALFLLSQLSLGQDIVEDENWLRGFGTEADYLEPLVYWDIKTFTLEDVARGKVRLKSVRQFEPQDEWEGVYYANTGIGDNRFIWNARGGFFSFYFYHTLKSLNFGKATPSSGFVELEYEKLPFSLSQQRPGYKSRLIKALIGETHFLVSENRLRDFCARAAGLNTEIDDVYYYWIKYEEGVKRERLEGLPILPIEYRKYLRYPVEAKVISVGEKKVIPNEQSTKEYNFDDLHYPVTIDAGRDKQLKKGMNLFVEDLGEWIQLTNVFQRKSLGFIRRDFDEKGNEECWDSEGGSGQSITCKTIRIGATAKTRGNL